MAKNINLSQKQKIEFRIVEIKKVSYFQNDFSELGLTKLEIKKGEVALATRFDVSEKEKCVSISIKTNFFVRKDEKRFDLFGIETSHKFEIRNFHKIFFDSVNKKYNIPDKIMPVFLNISISGTRGMLAALCSNPAYSKIILPIINPIDLLNSYKEHNKNAG